MFDEISETRMQAVDSLWQCIVPPGLENLHWCPWHLVKHPVWSSGTAPYCLDKTVFGRNMMFCEIINVKAAAISFNVGLKITILSLFIYICNDLFFQLY